MFDGLQCIIIITRVWKNIRRGKKMFKKNCLYLQIKNNLNFEGYELKRNSIGNVTFFHTSNSITDYNNYLNIIKYNRII